MAPQDALDSTAHPPHFGLVIHRKGPGTRAAVEGRQVVDDYDSPEEEAEILVYPRLPCLLQ